MFSLNVKNIWEYFVEYCQDPHNIVMHLNNGMWDRIAMNMLIWFQPMIGKNRQLVIDRSSLRYDQLKFKTARKLPIIVEEIIEYTAI